MNTDESDARTDLLLREAGREWRAGAERMPSLDEVSTAPMYQITPATRSGPRQLLAMASAAVAVAAVVVVVLIVRGGDHRTDQAAGTSRAGCDAASVAVDEVQVSHGPTGTSIAVTFTYRGDQPCTVSGGGPHVRLVDDQHRVLVAGSQTITPASKNVTMTPGSRLHFTALWSSWCGSTFSGATFDFNPNEGAAGWWVSTSQALTGVDVPSCQNGQSAMETDLLRRE